MLRNPAGEYRRAFYPLLRELSEIVPLSGLTRAIIYSIILIPKGYGGDRKAPEKCTAVCTEKTYSNCCQSAEYTGCAGGVPPLSEKYSERKKQNIPAARQRFVRCTRQQTDWDRQPAGGVKVSTGIGKFVKHAESA